MPPIVLTKEQKLKIILNRIGEYITNDIRNKRIYQSWISGDKYFYHLHESENINKYEMYAIFFYPISPEKWHLKIILKTVVDLREKRKTLIDFDFYQHEDECVKLITKLPKYHKIIDAIDNMCQTRLDQNPHYRTIQHEMALKGEIENSEEFLNKYYNPEEKKKHEEWAKRRQKWIEKNPIEALNALSRRKKMLISKGLAKPEDFGIMNLPKDYIIPNFEKERLDKIKETQKEREKEIKIKLNEKLKQKEKEALKKINNN